MFRLMFFLVIGFAASVATSQIPTPAPFGSVAASPAPAPAATLVAVAPVATAPAVGGVPTIAGLTEQVMRLEPELQKCDAEIQSFLSTNDMALMEQASGLGGYLTSIYQQLANAQAEADLLQTMTLDQNLLLEQGRSPVISSAPGNALGNSVLINAGLEAQSGLFAPNTIGTEYLAIKQQIQLLKADRERYAEYLKPKHPQMVALDLEIEKRGRVLDIFRQQSVEQLEAKKSALALQITNLESQTRLRGRENLEISRKAAHYERLKAKGARVQSLYDQLLATLQTLDVNKEISPESVTIYQAATDAEPDKTLFKKGMVMAGALGLGLGLVFNSVHVSTGDYYHYYRYQDYHKA